MGIECGCDIDCLCGPWGKCLAHEKPVKTSRPIKNNYIPLHHIHYIPHDDSGMEINPALIASLVLNVAFIITIIILATAR